MHHSASQCECDNILRPLPIGWKRVLVHPNTDHDWNRFPKIVSKMHGSTKCVILDEMQHFYGPRTPNLAPFSLSIRESLSRPRANEGEKNRTEARPSPGTARRCTGAFRVGRVPLHQQDSEIGRIRAQFARNRAWSGRGAPHSPGFSFWGSENIFIHIMHKRVGKYSEGSKKSSRAAFRPEYSRGSGRCTPVASENFFFNHRTIAPPMERSRSPPYWRGRNLLHRQYVARDDHPWAHNLEGELSVESIFHDQTKCHQVQQNGLRCTERLKLSWEGVSLLVFLSPQVGEMVEGGHPVTRMDFLTMATKSDPLGPVPLTVEREAQYCPGSRDTRAVKIARVHSP